MLTIRLSMHNMDFENYLKKLYVEHKHKIDKAKLGADAEIYGELHFRGFEKLQKILKLSAADTFLDIGSGFGMLAFQVALCTKASMVYGVEINKARCYLADKLLKKITTERYLKSLSNKIKFLNADFATTRIDATCVYTCSTVFPPSLLEQIANKINDMPLVRVVASMRKLPALNRLELSRVVYVYCSWETVPCYIYEAV